MNSAAVRPKSIWHRTLAFHQECLCDCERAVHILERNGQGFSIEAHDYRLQAELHRKIATNIQVYFAQLDSLAQAA